MKMVYKKIKVAMPHCPNCKNTLTGNGSRMSPYECSCGEWEYSHSDGEYNLTSPKDIIK